MKFKRDDYVLCIGRGRKIFRIIRTEDLACQLIDDAGTDCGWASYGNLVKLQPSQVHIIQKWLINEKDFAMVMRLCWRKGCSN
jgi:hypothetical protein